MPTVVRNFQYRCHPTRVQRDVLIHTLNLHRELYNAALQERRDAWRKCGVSVSFADQSAQLPAIRKIRDDLGAINAAALQQTLRKLDRAFQAFFRRVTAGQTPGFPRFKPADRFRSLAFSFGNGASLKTDPIGRQKIYLGGVGEIKVKWHRELPWGAQIKQVQVMVDGRDRWFVTLAIEAPAEAFGRPGGTGEVGIDVGLEKFVALSDGRLIANPRYYRRSQNRLAEAQRTVARRRRGSRRHRKAKAGVARIQAKIAEQRRDFHHKLSANLVAEYGFIAVENLNIRGLARGMLAKSVHDAGWAQFISFLKYKAESAGTMVEEVNARGTSQICPECGATAKKELGERLHLCPCGYAEDRDIAAARVILQRGQAAWTGPPEMAAAQAAA